MPQVSPGFSVWDDGNCEHWRDLLSSYPAAIARQGSDKLTNLDRWFREELPATLAERASQGNACIYLDELQGIAAWKMSRGVWRERNRVLVSTNPPDQVVETSHRAFAAVPDPKAPITILASLAGVGPANASAVLAAYVPSVYPFFDEAVGGQIPGLGPVAFTVKYYLAYAEALRERARRLTASCRPTKYTPHDVAQAMWAAWTMSPQKGA